MNQSESTVLFEKKHVQLAQHKEKAEAFVFGNDRSNTNRPGCFEHHYSLSTINTYLQTPNAVEDEPQMFNLKFQPGTYFMSFSRKPTKLEHMYIQV